MSYTPHHILFTPHLLDAAAVPLPYRDTQGCAGRLVNLCDYVTIREALAERTLVTGSQPDVTGLYPWIGHRYPDFRDLCASVRSACSNFVPRDYVPTSGTGFWRLASHALDPVSPDLTTTVSSIIGPVISPENHLRTYDHVRRMFRDLANMRRMVFVADYGDDTDDVSNGNFSGIFTFSYTGCSTRERDGSTSPTRLSSINTVDTFFYGETEGTNADGTTWSNGERWSEIATVTPELVSYLAQLVRNDASFAIRGGWAIGQLCATKSYIDDDGITHSVNYNSYVPLSVNATTHVIDTTAISGPALKAFCTSNGYTGHETVWMWSANGSISHILLDIDFPTNFDDANWTWTPS